MTDFLRIGSGCQGIFWNNNNISISTGNLNVGQPTTISVTINNTASEDVRVNGVQATVCALNTLHAFDSTSILPSLTGAHLDDLEVDNVFPFQSDIVIGPGGSTTVPLPQWTPTSNDIHHFDNIPGAAFDLPQKLTLHACVFANCFGSFPVVDVGQVTDDGASFNWNQISTNFCNDTHHGQHNTTLHRLANQLQLAVPFYAGLIAEGRLLPLEMQVTEITSSVELDSGVMDMIRRAGLGGLPIALASRPAKAAGVAQFRSVAQRIRELFEETGDEVKEFFEHLFGHHGFEDDESDDPKPKATRQVMVVPGELHPLIFKAEFDPNEQFGTVHVFEVTQKDSSGTLGGYRLVTVLSPD